ncbi:DUF4376 domain-containing protein [Rodentibacter abscessus]|uniref:DUF4376 domain-containing protein n=1 Tax=Rodentibacter abscessus TaxID=3381777 RepID=UPI00399C8CC0
MFYINLLDEQGNFELIDGDLLFLYPDLSAEKLIAITDEQYQAFCQQDNGNTKFIDGDFVFAKTIVDLTALLNTQRTEIRVKINAKRDKCVNGGVYVPAIDKWVDTDETGRATLVEIKADFDLNGKDGHYTLICADNTAKTIDFEQFKAVWDAVKTLKEQMFENAYMHKILLEQAENPLDYDWSVGWSKTYAEHKEAHNAI